MGPVGLHTPLGSVKGVGPRRAAALARKGLETVGDALWCLPLRHEDRTRFVPLARLVPDTAQTCAGTIVALSPPPRGSRLPFTVMLRDASGHGRASWFGMPWLGRTLSRGQRLVLHGPVRRHAGALGLVNPDYEILGQDGDERLHTGRLVPVYSAGEGLPQRPLRRLMWELVEAHAPAVIDPLPEEVRRRRELLDLGTALPAAHFPASEAGLAAARRRLVFDDFLFLALGLELLRDRTARRPGFVMSPPGELVRRLCAALPWRLTRAQERVWQEIRQDMLASRPMQRLLQGDVGAGKTIVAALAVLTAVEAGCQAALMAPTELLAEQHLATLLPLLEPLGVRPVLLTASVPSKEREALRRGLEDGSVPFVVGTHALLEAGVVFRRLALSIVDEQHRFGVRQRADLRERQGADEGRQPDLLVMTATPIPRTLALTLYGDLDVSVLDELPPGRRPVRTVARTEAQRARVEAFVAAEVAAGRQAYVVCPIVEESEVLDLAAATATAERLGRDVFPDRLVGLVHGRLAFDAREAVMRRFKAGEIHVLVATTVIEVGIDVPNASVMVIEHAERFGLAQLHQLRGRVGRGPWKSYCVLLHARQLGEDARRRLDAMVATTDGFRIAEEDLALRGPGQFFGTLQSGPAEFRVADLGRDLAAWEGARAEAARLVARDRELREPAHRELRRQLLERWRGKLALAGAG